eukprot:jgi/Chlat1/8073/Chrsp75S00603
MAVAFSAMHTAAAAAAPATARLPSVQQRGRAAAGVAGARIQRVVVPRPCRLGPGLAPARPQRSLTARCVLEKNAPAAPAVPPESEAASLFSAAQQPEAQKPVGQPIWLSDVVVTNKRNYWFDREWAPTDIGYVVFMSAMHIACLWAPATFSWGNVALFAGLYFITGCLGITLSFHRNLSHKAFKLPKWLEYTFAYCGVQAVQGDPLEWVSSHRYHHANCDTLEDPHTPYEGFWWSHMGWLLDEKATLKRVGARANIADMESQPFYKWIQKTYIAHPIAFAGLLYAFGGLPAIIWGMCLRVVWVYHITWLVNSASHVWGNQSWNTGDLSRNNWWVAVLAFGEGWHNNHHAFEYSARHGLQWWQWDPTWYVIKGLEKVGLATNVKLPRAEHQRRLAFETAPSS